MLLVDSFTLLSGVPTVVAKRMLGQQALVGRIVTTSEAATAAAADGANLVLVIVSATLQWMTCLGW